MARGLSGSREGTAVRQVQEGRAVQGSGRKDRGGHGRGEEGREAEGWAGEQKSW